MGLPELGQDGVQGPDGVAQAGGALGPAEQEHGLLDRREGGHPPVHAGGRGDVVAVAGQEPAQLRVRRSGRVCVDGEHDSGEDPQERPGEHPDRGWGRPGGGQRGDQRGGQVAAGDLVEAEEAGGAGGGQDSAGELAAVRCSARRCPSRPAP